MPHSTRYGRLLQRVLESLQAAGIDNIPEDVQTELQDVKSTIDDTDMKGFSDEDAWNNVRFEGEGAIKAHSPAQGQDKALSS